MPDDHILLFDEHKFNLMTIYFFNEFCYQKPTIDVELFLRIHVFLKNSKKTYSIKNKSTM